MGSEMCIRDRSQSTDLSSDVVVEVDVTNTSERSGTEVVQLYIAPPESTLHRPPIELKGYAKLALEPGETKTASITLNFRSFAYFDPGDQFYNTLDANSPVPRETGSRRTEPGWYVEPGVYDLIVARSVTSHHAVVEWELTGEENHQQP